MKALSAAMIGIALLAVAGCSTSAPDAPDLQGKVEQLAEDLRVPGMAVEVVDANGVVDRALTGHDGNGEPIDERTPFVWGSVSKSVTAFVVSKLAAEGRVRLDAPVVSVVPAAAEVFDDQATTVTDLIHHTSGLPHDLTRTDKWDRRQTALESVGDLSGVAVGERGSFRYSSLNYLLLQAVVERVTSQPFANAVDREIGNPSGAGPIIADAQTFQQVVPPGHVPFFTVPTRTDIGFDQAGLGYGYLAGSIEQLGKYGSLQLRDSAGDDPAPVATGGEATYGHGWYVENMAGADGTSTEVRWHSGAVPGYYTHVAVIPELGKAVVITAGMYGELVADRLAGTARSLVQAELGVPLPAPPGDELYLGILGALVIAGLALLIWVGRIVVGLVRRKFVSRRTRSVAIRVVCAIVIGGALVLAGLYGLPMLAGAPISVVSAWAPDVALLIWILLAEIALVTGLLVLRAIVEHRRQADDVATP